MSLADDMRADTQDPSPYRRVSTIVALLAAVLVGAFVLTSSLLSTLPEFRFDSQFPALLPFFAWAGAAGVGHLANLGRVLWGPWRRALGIASLVPWLLLMLTSAAAPDLLLPWWLAVVAAVVAMVPFLVLGVRAGTRLAIDPARDADESSLRGTFVIGVAQMLLAWAVTGSAFTGAVLGVLLSVALGVASMMPHGLARASRTWRLRHWAALAFGSLVIWASVLLAGLTTLFANAWVVLGAVLLAGLPLLIANAVESRRHRT